MSARRLKPLDWLAFAVAAWVAFTFAFTPLRSSHDEWWHLKTGEYIATRGLPENDIFTYTAGTVAWHNHEWLTQLAMWWTFRAGEAAGFGGLHAVIALKTLFVMLAFAGFGLLLARRMREPAWAALAAALAVALGRRTFYPRPPFVTYLLLALLFWMLLEWRAGRLKDRTLWALAPLFALWANLHGFWVAGLVTIGAFWGEALIDWVWRRFGKRERGDAARRLRRLSIVGGACAASVMLNPYGWHLLEIFTNVVADPYLTGRIGELAPPDWNFVWALDGIILLLALAAIRPVRGPAWAIALLVAAALAALLRWNDLTTLLAWQWGNAHPLPETWVRAALALAAVAAAVARLRPPGAPALLMAAGFFTWWGTMHVRHLPLAAIMLLPLMAWSLEHWALAAGRRPMRWAGLTLLALLAAQWTFFQWTPRGSEGASWKRNLRLLQGAAYDLGPARVPADLPIPNFPLPPGDYLVDEYPRATVDFILRAGLPERLWNGGNYAGYLIWRLAPYALTENGRPLPGQGYRLFTDNRYDVYGSRFIRLEHSVLEGLNGEEAAAANRRMGTRTLRFAPWNAVLDSWEVQTVFVPIEARLNMRLAAGGWAMVWAGPRFVIWVRDTPENRPAIDRAMRLERQTPVLLKAD